MIVKHVMKNLTGLYKLIIIKLIANVKILILIMVKRRSVNNVIILVKLALSNNINYLKFKMKKLKELFKL